MDDYKLDSSNHSDKSGLNIKLQGFNYNRPYPKYEKTKFSEEQEIMEENPFFKEEASQEMPIAPPLILLASKGFDSTLSKIGKWARPILILAIIVYLGFLVSSLQVIDYLQKGEIVDYTKSDEVKISEYIIN